MHALRRWVPTMSNVTPAPTSPELTIRPAQCIFWRTKCPYRQSPRPLNGQKHSRETSLFPLWCHYS
jgi:hypothetical protein